MGSKVKVGCVQYWAGTIMQCHREIMRIGQNGDFARFGNPADDAQVNPRVVDQITLEPVRERHGAIDQPLLPFGVPAAHEHFLIDPVHQRLLGREVPVQQGLRDAQFLGQVARACVEAVACEKGNRRLDDLMLAVLGSQTSARCGLLLQVCSLDGVPLFQGHLQLRVCPS